MQSPKFIFAHKSITASVSKDHLENAWRKKVKSQLRKQVLFDLIEFRDIDFDIGNIAKQSAEEVLSANYQVGRARTYLVEKSRGLCRQMMLVQPLDLVILQCLSTRLYSQINAQAPSKAAFFEPGQMTWSTGKMTASDHGYGAVASWLRFQKQVLKFSRENKFVVVTDVANFYDFINFKHLRNIIASICTDIDETILDLLIHFLNELAWVPDYMPRQEVGMPQIESEAPRVLANAMLFELDRVVESKAFLNYARFMDDIDFGAKSTIQARRMVRDIDLTLQSRQLRLNSAKTKILTQEQAYKHFCVKENAKLDRYQGALEMAKKMPFLNRKVATLIKARYEQWLSRTADGGPASHSVFLHGNGSKVLKRTLSMLRVCNIEPPPSDLIWLIRNQPELRKDAIRHLTHTRAPNTAFNRLRTELLKGTFVDDLSHIELASFCTHARFKKTAKLTAGMLDVILHFEKQGFVGLYAAALVGGRFRDTSELLVFAQKHFATWSKDYWLGRAIAGLYPRMHTAGSAGVEYLKMIERSNNHAAQSVLRFHGKLRDDAAFANKCRQYLLHDNPTLPQKIIFPKALQILSVQQNAAAVPLYHAIKAKHPALVSDPFFSTWGF